MIGKGRDMKGNAAIMGQEIGKGEEEKEIIGKEERYEREWREKEKKWENGGKGNIIIPRNKEMKKGNKLQGKTKIKKKIMTINGK